VNGLPSSDPIDRYLRRLDAVLADLPDPERHLIVSQVADQLDDAYDRLPAATATDVADMLAAFGAPEEIAFEALAAHPDTPRHPGTLRTALVLGGVAVLAAGAVAIGVLSAVAGPSAPPGHRPAGAIPSTHASPSTVH